MSDPEPDKRKRRPKSGPKCLSQKPNKPVGDLCQQDAGHGTDHPGVGKCSRHGGSTGSHAVAAGKELARRACLQLGVPVEIHPAMALLEEVFRTQGVVDYFGALVAELPTHPDDDELVEVQGGKNDGEQKWIRGEPGVYGRTYHVSGIPTGEAKPHVLYVLWMEERKHLAKVTSLALSANIAAERIQLEKDQASLVAEVCRGFAVALGHDPASAEVREAFGAQLRLIRAA
jgi:hypothetical protein